MDDANARVTMTWILSAGMFAAAFTILARIAVFVSEQSRSVFRFLFLWHPVVVLSYLPAGLVAAILFLIFTRKTKRPYLGLSAGVLVVSLLVAWTLPHEPLVSWLLPPADVK